MKYTCPCCGYKTFSDLPGSYEICLVCFWENDPVQILNPWYSGGANRLSLAQSQINFQNIGASDENGKIHARGVQPEDRKDSLWRLVNDNDRAFVKAPKDLNKTTWNELETWYYWLRDNS